MDRRMNRLAIVFASHCPAVGAPNHGYGLERDASNEHAIWERLRM
jgi:hypothetical protein